MLKLSDTQNHARANEIAEHARSTQKSMFHHTYSIRMGQTHAN